ncbi:MAG: hypothetical protein M0031_09785 [Thermaerobacter sp.]|nr:hypothetical protein [Thermaerobacter sp.]
MADTHKRARRILRTLSAEEIKAGRPTLEGHPVRVGRLLFALLQHESHHRGRLAAGLQVMGVRSPQVFGVAGEEVPSGR